MRASELFGNHLPRPSKRIRSSEHTQHQIARHRWLRWRSVAPLGVASAADISGAGATFPYPVYSKWAEAYKAQTGDRPELPVDRFGRRHQADQGHDGDLRCLRQAAEAKDLKDSGLVQWPMVIGGVVPVVNVPGIKAGELELDGPTLASIYLGEITKWNDARIKALNPKAKLPDLAIAPVYRSDGSGTNFLFTNYLSKVSPTFQSQGRRQRLGGMAGRHRRQGQ